MQSNVCKGSLRFNPIETKMAQVKEILNHFLALDFANGDNI